jgi:hypothetical protein
MHEEGVPARAAAAAAASVPTGMADVASSSAVVPQPSSLDAESSDDNSDSDSDDSGEKTRELYTGEPIEVEDTEPEWSTDSEEEYLTAANVQQIQQPDAAPLTDVPTTTNEVLVPTDVCDPSLPVVELQPSRQPCARDAL